MSFKRVGNDKSMLSLQKKGRVSELLAPEIPHDEVAVLNDGRFTCLVCNARPILDTVEILTIHRNGHKHKRNSMEFVKRKQEKLLLVEHRLHAATQSGKDTTALEQQKYELSSKSSSVKNLSKKYHPKLKVQLTQSDESRLKKDFKYLPSASLVVTSHPSSQSRANCLDKVTSTVQSSGFKKLQELSKLSESDKRQLQEHEVYKKSQGWLKDNDGNWIKDPNVEFDSDSDEEV